MVKTGELSHVYFALIQRMTRKRSEHRELQVGEVRRKGQALHDFPFLISRQVCTPPPAKILSLPRAWLSVSRYFSTGNIPTSRLSRNPSLLPYLVKRQAMPNGPEERLQGCTNKITGHPVGFKCKTLQHLGYTYTKKNLFVVYLKFNQVSSILSSNPILGPSSRIHAGGHLQATNWDSPLGVS